MKESARAGLAKVAVATAAINSCFMTFSLKRFVIFQTEALGRSLHVLHDSNAGLIAAVLGAGD
jgi:hypothetical protein